MDQLVRKLESGRIYFGGGSYNTEAFNDFFEDFKKSFTYQLKKLKATEISFSKGHFYISGFFKIEDQYYYFSLSDVRDGYGSRMLMRTAKGPEDYTGGSNNYVYLKNGVWKQIARTFGINIGHPQKRKNLAIEEIAKNIIEKGYADLYVGSMRKGNDIAWKVDSLLNPGRNTGMSIRIAKYGRAIAYAKAETDNLKYRYDAGYKRIELQILDRPFNKEAFLKTLTLPSGPEQRRNPFSGETEELEPLAVALYDYIKEAEIKKSPLFQEALLIFMDRYPKEYMTLLD